MTITSQVTTLPALPIVKASKGAQDHYVVFDDAALIAEQMSAAKYKTALSKVSSYFMGDINAQTALRMAREGDMSGVTKSDALLAKMEEAEIPSERFTIQPCVAGGRVNVPAFLAGHPMAMRRRVREATASAPLAIVADLTSSGGIDASDLQKRGIAILALVRALSARRPVELYIAVSTHAQSANGDAGACHMLAKIDTSPMDLMRAAHWISHPSMPRAMFYKLAEVDHGFNGSWGYGGSAMTVEQGKAVYGRVLPHLEDMLYIPAIHVRDACVTNPVQWIAETLAIHTGERAEKVFSED